MGKVLIISRDPAIAHAACTFLSQFFTAESCVPGPEAERLAAEGDVDVIVADIKTPEGQDLQFIRALKESHPRVPVVFLSLYASQLHSSEDKRLFNDAAFFPKPFENDAVSAAVALLSKTRRQEEGHQQSSVLPTAQEDT